MNALQELELKVGPLCRCITCCCKPGQGHKHPDWTDAWGEDEDVESEEAEVTESVSPQLKPFAPDEGERALWRRESAIRQIIGLIEKQPDLLNRHDSTGSYVPANHLVVAARIVEMAQAIEPYLSGVIDDSDEIA
jgi:hypothetical protein